MIDSVTIPFERVRILKGNLKKIKELENLCNAKISIRENEIFIECEDVLKLLRLKDIFNAFGRGFSFKDSMLLLDEDFYLRVINLKEYAKTKKRMVVLKGRVIGRDGKIKRMIEKLTKTKLSIYGKTVSIIGRIKGLEIAERAVRMILEGKKHGTVLNFLEKQRI